MKTTIEEAKENIHNELVNHLQSLLEKNYDAEKGFKKALQDTNNSNLKEYLKYQAVKRNRFATEIDKHIHELNEQPIEKGSIAGDMHRTWIDIKTAFTNNDAEAVLEECIRGDKNSLEEYEEKLKDYNFPAEIKSTLITQVDEIKMTLNNIKIMEDLDSDWK
ncbi:ferritin-like domain-containing protein [Mesonia aestuariivivens]|uniref:PA2169 family four-helix-bundle protein n=1 Tax=Mesonia aestuariivivens TaxID=2796128 RepID=A0ABS6W2D6_9FLAO|nr:PA2169 family four-helix-bundle protein [Mesonia aestuariivivens]MBW2962016.1 PA2169 family four-helix-bundle protein [Mesonia aestuariivivens]